MSFVLYQLTGCLDLKFTLTRIQTKHGIWKLLKNENLPLLPRG